MASDHPSRRFRLSLIQPLKIGCRSKLVQPVGRGNLQKRSATIADRPCLSRLTGIGLIRIELALVGFAQGHGTSSYVERGGDELVLATLGLGLVNGSGDTMHGDVGRDADLAEGMA